MQEIRLIISDLDFTLLNEKFELSDYTKRVLERILDNGIAFVPCSSRSLKDLPQWFYSQDKIRYLAASNGAVIAENHTRKVLVNHTLSVNKAKEIIKNAEKINPYWTCSVDGVLHSHLKILDDRELLNIRGNYLETILKKRVWETSIDFLNHVDASQIEKIHFVTEFSDKRDELIQLLAAVQDVAVASSHPRNIEVTHKKATKGMALRWLKDQYNCSSAQTMACGDNTNDISMLNEAYYSIGVANATDDVKNIVRFHALPYDQDGAAKMIEAIVFGEKSK